jgi:hypothetical protein
MGGCEGREGNTDFATKKLFGEKTEIDEAHLLGALKRWTSSRKRNVFEGTETDFRDAYLQIHYRNPHLSSRADLKPPNMNLMIQLEGISFFASFFPGARTSTSLANSSWEEHSLHQSQQAAQFGFASDVQLQSYKIYRFWIPLPRKWIRENMNKKRNRRSRAAKRASFLVVLEAANGTHRTRGKCFVPAPDAVWLGIGSQDRTRWQ